ncbi:hypothetical protein [Arthrobacter sp. PsM3]|uniref:hypothetical protein n=1 Tax=Arthrobacter sp. PsM3 TaxID=3030531 RepID=UPI00263B8FA2|nr:hypothetical protein [Arthrobacter sp. PsM3]MDN4643135.1 hypothetical protein [Arthrobacter sp. PsM3]
MRSSACHKSEPSTAGLPAFVRRAPTTGLREVAVAGVPVLPDLAVTRGRLQLIAEHPKLACRGYEGQEPQRDSTRAYLVRSVSATWRGICAPH